MVLIEGIARALMGTPNDVSPFAKEIWNEPAALQTGPEDADHSRPVAAWPPPNEAVLRWSVVPLNHVTLAKH
jgi:hypothetical protein